MLMGVYRSWAVIGRRSEASSSFIIQFLFHLCALSALYAASCGIVDCIMVER